MITQDKIEKLIKKIRDERDDEKITYSMKLKKTHAEILKNFFKEFDISPDEFFNHLINFNDLQNQIEKSQAQKNINNI